MDNLDNNKVWLLLYGVLSICRRFCNLQHERTDFIADYFLFLALYNLRYISRGEKPLPKILGFLWNFLLFYMTLRSMRCLLRTFEDESYLVLNFVLFIGNLYFV